MQKFIRQIPNLFTLLNLFFGCCAIVVILQEGVVLVAENNETQWLTLSPVIWYASLFIGLSAVVDFFDGFLARLLKASSDMGKQLDSLADVVSFGVAPSLILYHFLKLGYAQMENGLTVGWWALSPAFILACAAAYRLAAFNISTDQQWGFKGVPTPAVGLLVASFPLIYFHTENALLLKLAHSPWFWYAITVLLSYLMVSRLPLLALKFKDRSLKNNLPFLLLGIIALGSAILLGWIAIPVVFIAYIVVSLAFKNKNS